MSWGEQRLTIATKKNSKIQKTKLTQFKQSDSHRYKQTRQGERERGVCVVCLRLSSRKSPPNEPKRGRESGQLSENTLEISTHTTECKLDHLE